MRLSSCVVKASAVITPFSNAGASNGHLDGWEYHNAIERDIKLPAGGINVGVVKATYDHGMVT